MIYSRLIIDLQKYTPDKYIEPIYEIVLNIHQDVANTLYTEDRVDNICMFLYLLVLMKILHSNKKFELAFTYQKIDSIIDEVDETLELKNYFYKLITNRLQHTVFIQKKTSSKIPDKSSKKEQAFDELF